MKESLIGPFLKALGSKALGESESTATQLVNAPTDSRATHELFLATADLLRRLHPLAMVCDEAVEAPR